MGYDLIVYHVHWIDGDDDHLKIIVILYVYPCRKNGKQELHLLHHPNSFGCLCRLLPVLSNLSVPSVKCTQVHVHRKKGTVLLCFSTAAFILSLDGNDDQAYAI